MLKALERWGAAHPTSLAIISLVAGLILGALPVGVKAYNVGFYEGASTSDGIWKRSLDNKVKIGVEQQIAEKCGETVATLNASCQRTAKSLEAQISDKTQQIGELSARNDYLSKRSEIIDTEDALAGSASSILDQFLTTRAKRDPDSEAAARARFFSLLASIRRTNEIYTDWAGLFNSRATELFQRYNNKESISTDEIVGYLRTFTSDLDTKKKVIENQVNEVNKIRNSKY